MKKLLGLVLFLAILYALLLASNEGARSVNNHFNLFRRVGVFGVISLGAGMLIISGGIDLSIGSVVGLSATLLAMLLADYNWHPALAIPTVLAIGALIGLINGLLVTRLRLQAFITTLCGLFIYRGIARYIAHDQVKGLGNSFLGLKYWLYGATFEGPFFRIPIILLILLVLAGAMAVFLHLTVYGRYLFAIGSNEQAARYAGVATERYKVLAYVLCSTLAAFFGILSLMELNSAQPSSTGNSYELYAIAGAVLGGCSLRGGQGNVLGILIGTTILWILPNLTQMWGIGDSLQPAVIGAALLVGAIIDELLRGGTSTRSRWSGLMGRFRGGSGKPGEVDKL